MDAKCKNTREDGNQARSLDAVRRWQQLLKMAQRPEFTGQIKIHVRADQGKLGRIGTVVEAYTD